MKFLQKVKRKLVGQRGEDLNYEGWCSELQEDLRLIRDQRDTCDIDLGKYGDAHSQILLAIGGEALLNKVQNFCNNLTDEEKIKPEIVIPEPPVIISETGDAPPQYGQATEDDTSRAAQNLKDLQEKLRILEDIMGTADQVRLADQAQAGPSTSKTMPVDHIIPNLETGEVETVTEESAKSSEENGEASDEITGESPTDIAEAEPVEAEAAEPPEIDRTLKPDGDEVEVVEETNLTAPVDTIEEEKIEQKPSEKTEMQRSIEKKEAEIFGQMKAVGEANGPDDLPPTYEETCTKMETKESTFVTVPIAMPDIGDMPAIAALSAFFYTGEIVVSKKNYQDVIDIGTEFSIPAFITAAEEYQKMMGPDTDEESEISNLRYKHRDHKGAAQHLLLGLEQLLRKRKALKTDAEIAKSDYDWSIFGKTEVHRILLAATSLFFKKQITDQTVDLELPHSADNEIFSRIVDFMYTGAVNGLTQTMAREMLILCKEIEFKRLSDVLIDWLISRIRPDNCIELQLLGSNHNVKELADRARVYTLRHFKDVAKTDAFKELPCEWLIDYVKDDGIQVRLKSNRVLDTFTISD